MLLDRYRLVTDLEGTQVFQYFEWAEQSMAAVPGMEDTPAVLISVYPTYGQMGANAHVYLAADVRIVTRFLYFVETTGELGEPVSTKALGMALAERALRYVQEPIAEDDTIGWEVGNSDGQRPGWFQFSSEAAVEFELTNDISETVKASLPYRVIKVTQIARIHPYG